MTGFLGAEIPAGFWGWREHGRPRKARRGAPPALWVRLCKQIAYFMPRTAFAGRDTAAEPPVSLGMRPEKKIFTLHSSLSALFSALYEDLTFFPRLALDVG